MDGWKHFSNQGQISVVDNTDDAESCYHELHYLQKEENRKFDTRKAGIGLL